MEENKLYNSFLLTWYTNILIIGSKKKLELNDLPLLPYDLLSLYSTNQFQTSYYKCYHNNFYHHNNIKNDWIVHLKDNEMKNKYGVFVLFKTMIHCYGLSILKTGLIKAILVCLSFSGPLLLGYIVNYLKDGVSSDNILKGLLLISILSISSILTAIFNTNYNLRTLIIKYKIQGSLIKIIYNRCITLSLIAYKDLYLTESQINNIIQVDVDQLSNCLKSIHDLWSLPIQIIIACILLYINIQIAFIAGIIVIILLIPLNSLIAKQIGIYIYVYIYYYILLYAIMYFIFELYFIINYSSYNYILLICNTYYMYIVYNICYIYNRYLNR